MWRKLAHVQWVIGGSLGFATGVLTSLARPYVLRELILALDGGSNERAYSLAVGFAIVCAFESWTRTASRYWAGDCAPLMCVSASIQLVANKAMMLRVGAGKEGAETSLVGNDLFRLADMLAVAGVGLTGVASIISGTAMLLLWLGPIVRRRRRSKAFYPARFCLPPAPFPLCLADPTRRAFDVSRLAQSLIGLAVMVLCILVSGKLSKMAKGHISSAYGAADARINVMREIVDGAKVVKFMVWEEAYLDRLDRRRVAELGFHRKFRALQVCCIAIGRSSPMLGATVAFIVYSRFFELTTATILPALSIFQSLRLPFIILPLIFNLLATVLVSTRRVGTHLMLPDQPTRGVLGERSEGGKGGEGGEGSADGAENAAAVPRLRFAAAQVGWPRSQQEVRAATASTPASPAANPVAAQPAGDKNAASPKSTSALPAAVLARTPASASAASAAAVASAAASAASAAASDVEVVLTADFELIAGELVALVGPVGSGKSTILAAAWGEAVVVGGTVAGAASLGVVPQRPFTLAGTLEENILLGRPHDPARLAKVIELCAMQQDLERLPLHLKTEVGERGVTLSGGQQQRLGLARAFYAAPRLLLLDDPLSAVDAKTQRTLLATLREYVHGGASDEQPEEAAAAAAGGGAPEKARPMRPAALVALNQPHLVSAFDRVLEVSNGAIVRDCAPAEYLAAIGLTDVAPEVSVDEASDAAAAAAEASAPATAEPAPAAAAAMPASNAASTTATDTAVTTTTTTTTTTTAIPSKLITAEAKKDGTIGGGLLLRYLRAMGVPWVSAYLLLLLASFAAVGFTDWLLSIWASPIANTSEEASLFYLSWFGGLSAAQVLIMIACSVSWALGSVHASRSMHHDTTTRLMHAPLSWYEANPSGRVLSRFASDLGVCDMNLWQDIDTVFQLSSFLTVGVVIVAVQSRGILAAPGALVLVLLYVLLNVTDRSTREVKRLANNATSPILSNVREMRQGAFVARPLGLEAFLAARSRLAVSRWAGLSFHQKALNCWGTNVGSLSACLLCLAATLYFTAVRGTARDGAVAALGLTYAGNVPYFVGIVSGLYAQMRQSMTSLERLLEYLKLPQEAPRKRTDDPPPPATTTTATALKEGGGGGNAAAWPGGGSIEFDGLCVRYRQGLPLALDSFSARISARERVGVVGRTGAGKSSLMLALFRLVDAESGSIRIDGREIAALGLDAVRSCISIIPQEPMLFQGTVSHNLDPFAKRSDEEKAEAITRARLPREMLSLTVESGGVNLSSGERQLLCFARALLQPRPILVLDEATSNLDAASDAAMQALLRNELRACTLLTIAHRLQTVVDYDTIMVLGGGKLLEHDAPAALLAEGGGQGVLRSLAAALGEAAASELRGKAEEAARERKGRK